jgi:hypothetical protein
MKTQRALWSVLLLGMTIACAGCAPEPEKEAPARPLLVVPAARGLAKRAVTWSFHRYAKSGAVGITAVGRDRKGKVSRISRWYAKSRGPLVFDRILPRGARIVVRPDGKPLARTRGATDAFVIATNARLFHQSGLVAKEGLTCATKTAMISSCTAAAVGAITNHPVNGAVARCVARMKAAARASCVEHTIRTSRASSVVSSSLRPRDEDGDFGGGDTGGDYGGDTGGDYGGDVGGDYGGDLSAGGETDYADYSGGDFGGADYGGIDYDFGDAGEVYAPDVDVYEAPEMEAPETIEAAEIDAPEPPEADFDFGDIDVADVGEADDVEDLEAYEDLGVYDGTGGDDGMTPEEVREDLLAAALPIFAGPGGADYTREEQIANIIAAGIERNRTPEEISDAITAWAQREGFQAAIQNRGMTDQERDDFLGMLDATLGLTGTIAGELGVPGAALAVFTSTLQTEVKFLRATYHIEQGRPVQVTFADVVGIITQALSTARGARGVARASNQPLP